MTIQIISKIWTKCIERGSVNIVLSTCFDVTPWTQELSIARKWSFPHVKVVVLAEGDMFLQQHVADKMHNRCINQYCCFISICNIGSHR